MAAEAKAAVAPAPALVGLSLAAGLCACLAPWAPVALRVAAVAGAIVIGVAALDALWSWREGAPARVELITDGGSDAERVRMVAGREATLRAAMAWRPGARRVRLRMAWMAGNAEFERVITLPTQAWQAQPPAAGVARSQWTWTVTGRARGRFHGLVVGMEQASRLHLWRMRHWQAVAAEFCVYPDLAPGQRALLRSRVYRAVAASVRVPLTGQGREFERLREYQSGDNYADVSWKATARRAHPVTRLYQWEQQQEIYFVVDHGRRSRLATADGRTQLEHFLETALVGATAAMTVGDRFGLISFAGEVSQWLAASSGNAHFRICRERLLGLQASTETPNFERLFSAIQTRLRHRCYLLLLTDLTERGLAEAFRSAARLVGRTHVMLAASLLPGDVHPLGSEPLAAGAGVEGVYRELAAELELRRIEALRRQLAPAGVQFRALGQAQFLPSAIDSYLESKREQQL